MTKEELKVVLEKHEKWLNGEENGERANLTEANLRWANLTEANLTGANLRRANLTEANLTEANLTGANLTEANLTGANLRQANLRQANLRQANLDFASWPLWCGSLKVKTDSRIRKQLAYHLLSIIGEDKEDFLKDPVAFANGFHKAGECGVLE